MPLLILGASMLASTAMGAARGALDAYLEMTTGARPAARSPAAGSRMKEFATCSCGWRKRRVRSRAPN